MDGDGPDWAHATVAPAKLDFLLGRTLGHHSARATRRKDRAWLFVGTLGFSDAALLRASLLAHAVDGRVVGWRPIGAVNGVNYEVRGPFVGQNGRQITLITIWCVLAGESAPAFVTAYPGARRTGTRIRP